MLESRQGQAKEALEHPPFQHTVVIFSSKHKTYQYKVQINAKQNRFHLEWKIDTKASKREKKT
jgi:hypothetical protein